MKDPVIKSKISAIRDKIICAVSGEDPRLVYIAIQSVGSEQFANLFDVDMFTDDWEDDEASLLDEHISVDKEHSRRIQR